MELEILLFGKSFDPNRDIKRLISQVRFSRGYSKSSPMIASLWNILRHKWEPELSSRFLRFVTGSPRVPHHLPYHPRFTIQRVLDASLLPSASTCFNLLKLPEYSSEDELERKLRLAVTEAVDGGFGLS